MGSALQPSLWETTSLARLVFQQCGSYGMVPIAAIDSGDWLGIAKAEMPRPERFSEPTEYAKAYLSYNLLRKFNSLPIPLDKAAAASVGFDQSEVSCGRINREVSALPWLPGVPLGRQQQSCFELARSLIKRALGRFDFEEFQMACDFSNGASTRLPRKRGSAAFKLEGKPHVTHNCRDLAIHFMWCNEAWRNHCQDLFGRESDPYTWVELVPGSRFETVPKTSLTDRPICIEPDLNMFFQKGIGKMIRRRLKRVGINLRDQTRNQLLALKGSWTGLLATIDLSSASDSISLWLVENLLPESWVEMLLTTRSPYVLKDGRYRRLEKISSMGNGYTFELESLIFWALTKACCIVYGEDVADLSIYGDDIICPVGAAQPVIDLLASVGFQTNKDKTFIDGPFRESCGKHYFQGVDVSPFKIESPLETWSDLYHFCNSLQEWGWLDPSVCDEIVSRALKPIPPRNRCYVPPSFSSKSGLRVSHPKGHKKWDSKLGCHVYKFNYMAEKTNDHDMSGPYAYLGGLLLREQRSGSVVDDTPTVDRRHTHRKSAREFLREWNEPPRFGRITKVDSSSWYLKTGTTSDWHGVCGV